MFQIGVKGLDKRSLCSRRLFLQTSLATAGVFSVPNLLRQRAEAAESGRSVSDTAVIQIWLAGGPSHMDMYDLKPDAPVEYRGFYQPIRTNVPGLEICELMPQQTRLMDRLAVVRSMHHGTSEHPLGTAWMLTGYDGPTLQNQSPKHPCAGSIAAKLRGSNSPGMPPYVHIHPERIDEGMLAGYHGAAYLGPSCDPFVIQSARVDPDLNVAVKLANMIGKVDFDVPTLKLLPDLPLARLDDRRHLMKQLDGLNRHLDTSGMMDSMDHFHGQAFSLIRNHASGSVFDLSREDARLRERYGMNAWGQGALLCRRMVEAGVTFVTFNTDSTSRQWDNHHGLKPQYDDMLPVYDQFLTALIEDLVARGLYDRVLVLVCGEFGRTPKVNRHAGRDHWGPAGFVLMGGGGLRGGVVVGSTTPKGEVPHERPVTPADMLATVYHVLGIDTRHEFFDQTGRPIPVLNSGNPIRELV